MGVNLSPITEPQKINFSSLSGKIVAIDAFNTLYQFLASIRQEDGTPFMDLNGNITSHLQGLLYRTTKFLEYKIKVAYVFDGKPLPLKQKEIERRREEKKKALSKFERALEEEREEAFALSKGTVKLSKEMIEESKELLDAIGVPYVLANHEGEAKASILCKENKVYAVASQDYDPLLFRAPRLIRNLTLQRKRRIRGREIFIYPEQISLDSILKNLQISQEKLIWMGILIGTDFNKGVRGVAAKTALKLVKKFNSFDELKEYVEQKYDHVFEENIEEAINFFKDPEEDASASLNWKKPNKEKLFSLLVEKHDFNEQRVINTYNRLINAYNKMMQKGISEWL